LDCKKGKAAGQFFCQAAFFLPKQTSFSPNFNNKTTAVAGQSPQNKTSLPYCS
jgi:hypothetical protein